jgi:hypothetical protein
VPLLNCKKTDAPNGLTTSSTVLPTTSEGGFGVFAAEVVRAPLVLQENSYIKPTLVTQNSS